MELYLHSTSPPPWHILGQLYFTFTTYISLNRSHPFWSYKGALLHITYLLHEHYMTHLFNLQWSNYINITNSSNNKTSLYTFHCPSVINSLSRSDILLKIFSLKFPRNTLFIQCKKPHLLLDDTVHRKWNCTCSESQTTDLFS